MSRDAKLNDLIRLKRTPVAPVERWQMIPTKQKQPVGSRPVVTAVSSPLRCTTNTHMTAKTPDSTRLVIKYKRTPKKGIKSPCYKTPSHKVATSSLTQSKKKSPPKSSKKKTPGRTGQTPSGCRFIPNRCFLLCGV